MKRLRLSRDTEIRYPGDVALLQAGLRREGYGHTDEEVQAMWEAYSTDVMCAGWLGVRGADDAWSLIHYLGDPADAPQRPQE